MRRLIGPLLLGVVGAAILIALGVWQMQRLAWKEGVLAEIEARIAGAPVAVPEALDPAADRYLPVMAEGHLAGDPVRVLVSQRGIGAGYRLIVPVATEGRDLLVDLGVVPVNDPLPDLPEAIAVAGNLHWPQEVDAFTPENAVEDNIWFARDVPTMAAHLGTEEVLIVARRLDPAIPGLTPLPVGTEGIPNDHLNYAITWFSLAAVWLGMTAYLVWRITRRSEERA